MSELHGWQGILYYGTAGAEATNEAPSCRNVTPDRSFTEGETTTKGDGGNKTYSPGLHDCSIEIEMIVPAEGDDAPDYEAILAAANGRSKIALLVLTEEDGHGIGGDFHIFTVGAPQEIEGVQFATFKALPAKSADNPLAAVGIAGGSSGG